MENKPFWQSKTLWLGLLTALIGGLEFYRDNTIRPETMALIGGLIVFLRLITNKSLKFN